MLKNTSKKPVKPVELVEYGDFECPNCLEAYPIVRKLRKHFKNNLVFEWKNFPISESHPHAVHAAHAAEAARLQGKFDDMHDLLFENQDSQKDEDILKYAKKIGLDIKKFIKDFESKETASKVRKDLLEGARKGVNGTPTFFINGKRHNRDYSYEELEHAIKNRL